MTARITFERTGGQKIRISLADVEVSGLGDVLRFLAMLTVEEAADVLHTSRDKVYFLIRTGQLSWQG